MKKFLAGIVVGSIGTFGALLVEAEKRRGLIKRIAAKALRMYADKLDPKWGHNYADYNTNHDADYSLFAIEYPSQEMAENVLGQLLDKLKKDGTVTVADYMSISHHMSKYTDYEWGWYDLQSAYVYYYNAKGVTHYGIHLPEPVYVEHMN